MTAALSDGGASALHVDAELAVIGSGPAALALLARLARDDPSSALLHSTRVIDPSGAFCTAWAAKLRSQGVSHLRSPTFVHPHPSRRLDDALHGYAATRGRLRELRPIEGVERQWQAPSSRLFEDFCEDLAADLRGGKEDERLAGCHVAAAATDIVPLFRDSALPWAFDIELDTDFSSCSDGGGGGSQGSRGHCSKGGGGGGSQGSGGHCSKDGGGGGSQGGGGHCSKDGGGGASQGGGAHRRSLRARRVVLAVGDGGIPRHPEWVEEAGAVPEPSANLPGAVSRSPLGAFLQASRSLGSAPSPQPAARSTLLHASALASALADELTTTPRRCSARILRGARSGGFASFLSRRRQWRDVETSSSSAATAAAAAAAAVAAAIVAAAAVAGGGLPSPSTKAMQLLL